LTSRRWGQNHPHRGEQEVRAVWELELSREKGRSSTIPSLVEETLDDVSDSYDGSGDNTSLLKMTFGKPMTILTELDPYSDIAGYKYPYLIKIHPRPDSYPVLAGFFLDF
jgi:hypothetical protein